MTAFVAARLDTSVTDPSDVQFARSFEPWNSQSFIAFALSRPVNVYPVGVSVAPEGSRTLSAWVEFVDDEMYPAKYRSVFAHLLEVRPAVDVSVTAPEVQGFVNDPVRPFVPR